MTVLKRVLVSTVLDALTCPYGSCEGPGHAAWSTHGPGLGRRGSSVPSLLPVDVDEYGLHVRIYAGNKLSRVTGRGRHSARAPRRGPRPEPTLLPRSTPVGGAPPRGEVVGVNPRSDDTAEAGTNASIAVWQAWSSLPRWSCVRASQKAWNARPHWFAGSSRVSPASAETNHE